MEHRPIRPSRALRHPIWLVSLAVLLLNDHLLKGSGLLPGWLTGKLSDIAGLVFAPVLLAALVGARRRRDLLLAYGAVAGVFAALNLSHELARGCEAAMALIGVPWHMTVDPTDLLALPVLLLSWRLFVPVMVRPAAAPPFRWPLIMLGIGASMGSYIGPPDPYYGNHDAIYIIGNETGTTYPLRVRQLKAGVDFDCAAAATDPADYFHPALFTAGETWEVAPNQTVPLPPDAMVPARGCDAYLVDGTGLPPFIVFLSSEVVAQYSNGYYDFLPGDAAALEQEDLLRYVRLRPAMDDEKEMTATARWFLSTDGEAMLYRSIDPVRPLAAGTCALPEEAAALSWTSLPIGSHTVDAVARHGTCTGLDLTPVEGGASKRWYLCAPEAALPIQAGDTLSDIGALDNGANGGAVTGVKLTIERDGTTAYQLHLARGSDLVPPPYTDTALLEGYQVVARSDCAVQVDRCGQRFRPRALTLADGTALAVGEQVGAFWLHDARAVEIADGDCEQAFGQRGDYFESIYLKAGGGV